MARTIATTTTVDLDGLLDFVRPRHKMIVTARRSDGRPDRHWRIPGPPRRLTG
jgi:hypothetical protein